MNERSGVILNNEKNLSFFTVNFCNQKVYSVVYYDQHIHVVHSKHWLKSSFLMLPSLLSWRNIEALLGNEETQLTKLLNQSDI